MRASPVAAPRSRVYLDGSPHDPLIRSFMNPLALLGFGLLLGLRHAADPDHVVAVSAITARTRRVLGAAWLGVVWGLGHTLTLFGVGVAIILFNLVVPPRVGLAFELT